MIELATKPNMNDQERIATWATVTDLNIALNEFIYNSHVIGTDPYYADLNEALWAMLVRCSNSPWQPMASAPLDGTRVIVKTTVMHYLNGRHQPNGEKIIEARHICRPGHYKPEWVVWCGNDHTFSTEKLYPTAWMGIPVNTKEQS